MSNLYRVTISKDGRTEARDFSEEDYNTRVVPFLQSNYSQDQYDVTKLQDTAPEDISTDNNYLVNARQGVREESKPYSGAELENGKMQDVQNRFASGATVQKAEHIDGNLGAPTEEEKNAQLAKTLARRSSRVGSVVDATGRTAERVGEIRPKSFAEVYEEGKDNLYDLGERMVAESNYKPVETVDEEGNKVTTYELRTPEELAEYQANREQMRARQKEEREYMSLTSQIADLDKQISEYDSKEKSYAQQAAFGSVSPEQMQEIADSKNPLKELKAKKSELLALRRENPVYKEQIEDITSTTEDILQESTKILAASVVANNTELSSLGYDNLVENAKAVAGPDADAWQAADYFAKSANRTLNAPDDTANGFVAFLKGHGDTFSKEDFWTMGLTSIAANMKEKKIFDKIRTKLNTLSDENLGRAVTDEDFDNLLSEGEKAALKAFVVDGEAQALRAYDINNRYTSGNTSAESIGFMAQFLMTGGIGKAASSGLEKAFSTWLKKAVSKSARRAIGKGIGRAGAEAAVLATKGAIKTAEAVAVPIVRTLPMTFLQTGLYKDYAQKLTERDAFGNLVYDYDSAILPSVRDYGLEVWSEQALEPLLAVAGSAFRVVGNNAMKGLEQAGINSAKAKFLQTKLSDFGKFIHNREAMKILTDAGFDGFLEEIGEEYLGAAVSSIWDEGEAWKQIASKDGFVDMAIAFAPMSVLGGGATMGNYIKRTVRYNKALPQVREILHKAGVSEEDLNAMLSRRTNTLEDVGNKVKDIIKPLVDAGTLNLEETKAVWEFVDATAQKEVADALIKREQEDRKIYTDALVREQLGGKEYHSTDADGNKTVSYIEEPDGSRRYVITGVVDGQGGLLSYDENGENVKFIQPSDAIQTVSYDTFLESEFERQRKAREEQRMAAEREAKEQTLAESLASGKEFDLYNESTKSKLPYRLVQWNGNDAVVATVIDGNMIEEIRPIDQVANALGVDVSVLTDAEAEQAQIDKALVLDQKVKGVNHFKGSTISLGGETGMLARVYTTANEEGATTIKANLIVRGGQSVTVDLAEEELDNIQTTLEEAEQKTPKTDTKEEKRRVRMEDRQRKLEEDKAYSAVLKRYKNPDGTVRESDFLADDPVMYARYSDEHYGKSDTNTTLEANIKIAAEQVAVDLETMEAETDPDKKKVLRDKYNNSLARLNNLNDLMAKRTHDASTDGSLAPEQAADKLNELLEQGLTEDEVAELAQNSIEAARERISLIPKPEVSTDVDTYIKAKKAYEKAVGEEQRKIDYWTSILEAPMTENEKKNPQIAKGRFIQNLASLTNAEAAAKTGEQRAELTKRRRALIEKFADSFSGEDILTYADELQRELDYIADRPTTVVTYGTVVQQMRLNGATENAIGKVLDQMGNIFLMNAMGASQKIDGFHNNGNIYIFAEGNASVEDATTTYYHERQHDINAQDSSAVDAVLEQFGNDRKALYEELTKLIGKSAVRAYNNCSAKALADEIVAFTMEKAYTDRFWKDSLSKLGLNENLINTIEEQYGKQKSENNSDGFGDRNSNDSDGRREDIGEDGRTLEDLSEDEQLGLVPDGESADNQGVLETEEVDENGLTASQRREINTNITGGLELENGSVPVQFSVTAMVKGVGLDYHVNDDGSVTFVAPDGSVFDSEHHITTADLRKDDYKSAFKYLDQFCLNKGFYNEEMSEQHWQKYADMLNAFLDKGAGEGGIGRLTEEWQWIADSVYKVFRAVASNSDDQYSKSLDITRVCKKNEAVITAIAIQQRKLGYGITPGQVMDIYYETIEAGYQAPCPVCYVFSRYIRNGQYATIMVNGKKKYGDHLQDVSTLSLAERKKAIQFWLKEYDKQVALNNANKKEITSSNAAITTILDRIDKLEEEFIKGSTTKERRDAIRKEMNALDTNYKTALEVVANHSLDSWITQFAIHKVKGKDAIKKPGVFKREVNGEVEYWDVYEDQRPFPDEIALDLRETASAMTEYAAVQRYRNSRGAAAGKEITFAADNAVGEVALMLSNEKDPINYLQKAVEATNKKDERKYLKKANDKLAKAHIYLQRQTLRGGQRMWSWSDNIERLAPDVFINMLQLEMLSGGVQAYSKQLEGIKSVATMDAYVNGSLMGRGLGYMEVPEEMIAVKDGHYVLAKPITHINERTGEEHTDAMAGDILHEIDGKLYALVFDDVVGIQAFAKADKKDGGKVKKGLFDLNKELDKAGNILVGMDDMHIRMAMADDRIFFIIPWHSSGANNHILNQMYRYMGAELQGKPHDYTKEQEEKYLGKAAEKETKDEDVAEEVNFDEEEETEDEKKDAVKVSAEMEAFWESHKDEENYPCGLGHIPSGDGNGELHPLQIEYKALRDICLKGVKIPTIKNKKGEISMKTMPIREAAALKGDAPEIVEAREMYKKIKNDIFLAQVEETVYNSVDDHLMTSGDTKYIYPYEYWNLHSRIEEADENGRRYVEYCRRMGYKPKFSGTPGKMRKLNPSEVKGKKADLSNGYFVDDKGYWKLLIDRRMYDRMGYYQGLVPVSTARWTPDLIDPSKTREEFIITEVATDKGNEEIARRAREREARRPGGLAGINYDHDLTESIRLRKLALKDPLAYYKEVGADRTAADYLDDTQMRITDQKTLDEMETIKANARVNGSFMKAPNGNDTLLSEDQWALVRTSNFKNWFGDWENNPEESSKIVDENGEPRVVYHGSGTKFYKFNKNLLGMSTGAESAKAGFFFADNKGLADWFAENYGDFIDSEIDIDSYYQVVREQLEAEITEEKADDVIRTEYEDLYGEDEGDRSFLNGKTAKEYVIDKFFEEMDDGYYSSFREAADRCLETLGVQLRTTMPVFLNISNPMVDDIRRDYTTNKNVESRMTSTLKKAHANGNDGVVFTTITEFGGEGGQYVAFAPNQIKSATDNFGGFTPDDDIRFRYHEGQRGYGIREDGTAASDRAIAAEEDGRFTKGKFIQNYHISKDAFDAFKTLGVITSGEWHHTGKAMKKSDFFGWDAESTAENYTANKKEIDALVKDYADGTWEWSQRPESFERFLQIKAEAGINFEDLDAEEDKQIRDVYSDESLSSYDKRGKVGEIRNEFYQKREERRQSAMDSLNRDELQKEYDSLVESYKNSKASETGKESALLRIADLLGVDKADATRQVAFLSDNARRDAENKNVRPTEGNEEEQRESAVQFSIVDNPDEIARLDAMPSTPVYHAMQKITMEDGKTYLFPPMAAIQGGSYVQGIPVVDGKVVPTWERADERQDLAVMYTSGKRGKRIPEDATLTDGVKTIKGEEVPWKFYEGEPVSGEYNKETGEFEPNWYFALKKGNKDDNGAKLTDLEKVAFDPYQHSGVNAVNDQFTSAYKRSHLVIVKALVPTSEMDGTSGYKAEKAKLGVGTHPWTGGVLKTDKQREVTLSRWDKVTEILTDEEVAKQWKEVLDENNLTEVPFNIVTPSQRDALIDLGVAIGEPSSDNGGTASIPAWEEWKRTEMEKALVKANSEQKSADGKYADDADLAFRISNNNRTTITKWLEKWADAKSEGNEETRAALQSTIDNAIAYIDTIDDATTQLATAKWFCKGSIVLGKEDEPKVRQAIKVAKIKKVDPLTFDSPMEIVNKYGANVKGERINPDTVPTLHKVDTQYPYGIVVYDVDESRESRQNMREIINTHFGKDCSPWCLLQGDEKGRLTKDSGYYWGHYSAYHKQVAFQNGKLLAFSANFKRTVLWWDKQDKNHYGIPYSTKSEDGRTVKGEINSKTGKIKVSKVYKGDKQNGLCQEWNADGVLTLESNYKDGKLDGKYLKYYGNGNLEIDSNYKDGELDGKQLTYHKNGNLQEEVYYKDGKEEGKYVSFHPNGSLKQESNFKNGKREGKSLEYYESGNLKIDTNYENGKREGKSLEYYENGNVESETNRKNGKLDGKLLEYYENGNLKMEADYKKNEKDGRLLKYYENGNLKEEANYKDGRHIGKWLEYYENGNLKREAYFEEGEPYGKSLAYYENGNLKEEANLNKGWFEGKRLTYYENGNIESESNYENGKPEGRQISYYEDGSLRQDHNYKNNQPHGKQLDYYANGNPRTEYNFRDGRFEGRQIQFYEDGYAKEVAEFKNDRQLAPTSYYRSGAVRFRVYEKELNSNQKRANGHYPSAMDLDDIEFRLSKNNRATIEKWLDKWADAKGGNEEELQNQKTAALDYLDSLTDATEQLATAKWFCSGAIVLGEEDRPKVQQAIKIAKIKKIDALQYGSPMEIINQFGAEVKGERINPDTVPTLHRVNKQYPHGIVVYDVDESEESRRNMREIINSHFGKDCSPWCLLQGDKDGKLTAQSARYWKHYNAHPKQVAFQNGKLLAFSANDEEEVLWWDRRDESHGGIPINSKDEEGRSIKGEINSKTGKIKVTKAYRGNKQNGLYQEWDADGVLTLEANYKDGKLEGKRLTYYPSGNLKENINYKDDVLDGKYLKYHKNGNLKVDTNFKNGKQDGKQLIYYENGNLKIEADYKNSEPDGKYLEYYENGKPRIESTYEDGKLEGKQFEYYPSGELEKENNYKDDKLDGKQFEYQKSGKLKGESNYKDGKREGKQLYYYANGKLYSESTYEDGKQRRFIIYNRKGNIEAEGNYKDNKKDGKWRAYYYKTGNLIYDANYKDGKEDGKYLTYYENGNLRYEENYKYGHLDGKQLYYDENGNLTKVTNYWEGILLRDHPDNVSFRIGPVAEMKRTGMTEYLADKADDFTYSALKNVGNTDIYKNEVVAKAAKNGGLFYGALLEKLAEIADKNELTEQEEEFIEGVRAALRDTLEVEDEKITANELLWMAYDDVHRTDEGIYSRIHNQKVKRGLKQSKSVAPEMSLQDYLDAAEKDKKDLVALYNAMMATTNELNDITKAMSARRGYDRTTVGKLVSLANALLQTRLLDNMSKGEIKRLTGIIRKTTGMKNISSRADELYSLILTNQIRNLKSLFEKELDKKAVKVNGKNVIEQSALDVRGQKMMEALKENLDSYSEDTEGLIVISESLANKIQETLSKAVETPSEELDMELTGLGLARDYIENIKASEAEEQNLRSEMEWAKEEHKKGVLDDKAYRQFNKETKKAITENRAERVNAYINLVQKLQDITAASHTLALDFARSQKERVAAIHGDAARDMEGRPNNEHQTDPTFTDKLVNNPLVRTLLRPLATFDQMLRLFGSKSVNGEGYLWNRFMRAQIDATGKEFKGMQSAYRELDNKVAEVFGKKGMKWANLYSIVRRMPTVTVRFNDGDRVLDHELTQGNLLYLVLADGMTDGRMKLRAMGITEEDIQHIKRQIDPRFMILGDWLVNEFLPSRRETYNEVYKKMFGANMSKVENYFPLKILPGGRIRQVDVATANAEATMPSTVTGNIMRRTRNALALDILNADAFGMVVDHINKMEHWKAFAEFNRDLSDLLSYKNFRNQVENMTSVYGSKKELWNEFVDVAMIASGSYSPKTTKLDKAMMGLARGVTAAKISLRIYTAIKQFESVLAYFSEVNPIYLVEGIYKGWKWSMDNLPVFEKRWKSRTMGDHILSATEGILGPLEQELSKVGMTANAAVDAFTVSMGAYAIFKTKYNKYIKMGYSAEKANERAKQDAVILFNETQQSSEAAFMSVMQSDKTMATVAFTIFRNSSMGYQRQDHDALRNFKRRMTPGYRKQSIEFMTEQLVRDGISRATAERGAKMLYNRQGIKDAVRLALFGYIIPLGWNLMTKLPYLIFGDDDDEKRKMFEDAAIQSISGPIEGLTGGNVLSEGMNLLVTGEGLSKWNPTLLPVVADVTSLYQEFGRDNIRGINSLINLAVQMGVGVNPQTIEDVVFAVIDACHGDLGWAQEALLCSLRIMQAPQSSLDKLYLDEVGMSAREAKNLSVPELAERYAKYKIMRGSGPMTPAYGKDAYDKTYQRLYKRFGTMATERLSEENLDKAYLTLSDESAQLQKTLKDLQTKVKGGDEDARLELNDLFLSEDYGKMLRFDEANKGVTKEIKAAIEAPTAEEMRSHLAEADRLKKEIAETIVNDEPGKYYYKNQFYQYTQGVLPNMAKEAKRYLDEYKKAHPDYQENKDAEIDSINADIQKVSDRMNQIAAEKRGYRKVGRNGALTSTYYPKYKKQVATLNEELAGLSERKKKLNEKLSATKKSTLEMKDYIPSGFYNSDEFQTYLKFKDQGTLSGNTFVFRDVKNISESIKNETDPEKREKLIERREQLIRLHAQDVSRSINGLDEDEEDFSLGID